MDPLTARRGISSRVSADTPNDAASTTKAAVDARVAATRAPPRAGRQHEGARPHLVGQHPADRDQHGAWHAVAGQHDAEQDRAAVRGEH